ncbi:MAG: hypothetical protein ACUVWR_01150 [Anaerolineae bacterium]
MLEEYYLKAAADIDNAKQEAERWRKNIEKATSEVQRQYYEEIQDLDSKCDRARIALNQCVMGKEPPTEEQRATLERALAEVREAVSKLTAKFR